MTTIDEAVAAIMARSPGHLLPGQLRELPPQNELQRPLDRAPIELISERTWNCRHCESADAPPRTIQWSVVPSSIGPQHLGRCRECGQKFCVAGE